MRTPAALIALAALLIATPSPAPAQIPGLVGSTGDDQTLDYLYALQTFEDLPDWPRFYFSDDSGNLLPPGSDLNPCTELLPCRTAQKMQEVLSTHEVIVVLDAGVWDTPGEFGAWTGFLFDNTGCGAGAADTMTDDPCAFIVPYAPAQPATFNCSSLSGSVDLDYFLATEGYGTGYLGIAGIISDTCPEDADGVGADEWGIALKNPYNGNLVAINVDVRNVAGFHNHTYRSSDSAHLVLINSTGSAGDNADYNSDCAGPSCAANLCVAGSVGDPYGCCDGGTPAMCLGNSHIWEVNSWGNTLISNRTFEIKNTQIGPGASAGCFVSDCENKPCYNVVIGPTCKTADTVTVPPEKQSYCYSNLSPEDTNAHTYYLARMTCLGWPANVLKGNGIRLFTNNDSASPGSVSINLFQNTITRVYQGIHMRGQSSGDTMSVTARCNLLEGMRATSGDAFVWEAGSGNQGSLTFDVDGSNVYDTDDNGSGNGSGTNPDSFRIAGQQKTAGEVSSGAGYTIVGDFFGADGATMEGLESGSVGTDGNVFDGGTTTCAAGALCEDACQTTQFIPLSSSAFVPTAAVGQVITAFNVGTHYQDAGAPPVIPPPPPPPPVPALPPRGMALLTAVLIGLSVWVVRGRPTDR